MSRRLDVEITSLREDGSFTWRVVGAKQPKGEAAQSVLPGGAKVGDQLRVEADFLLDGIEIVSVLPAKAARKEPELLKITGSGSRNEQLVTTQLVAKGGRDRRDRRDRGDRPPRDGRDGARPRRDGEGSSSRRPGGDRPRRPAPPPLPEKARPKRIRARRVHRDAVLAGLPPEQVPVAEQIMQGGIPAVRQAIEKQNEENKAAGLPEVHAADLLTLAENLAPALKTAEWRDRADAALADIGEIDLRDLRSVVVGADTGATDDEGRALAARLREALGERVEREQAEWLAEIRMLITSGRTIRALRLSSRPPKAGSPIPADLAKELAEATVASVDDSTLQDRWGAMFDALAFSPIRGLVTFEKLPSEPSEELLNTVRGVADRIPAIAKAFGIEPPAPGARPSRQRRRPGQGGGSGQSGPAQSARAQSAPSPAGPAQGGRPIPPPPPAQPAAPAKTESAPADEAPADEELGMAAASTEHAAEETAATETVTAESEAAPVEAAAADAAPAEAPAPADGVATEAATEEPAGDTAATESEPKPDAGEEA